MACAQAAVYAGVITALFATMQFLAAPVLGSLSDRYGRRPVLLASLAAFGVNYLLMAFAPTPGVAVRRSGSRRHLRCNAEYGGRVHRGRQRAGRASAAVRTARGVVRRRLHAGTDDRRSARRDRSACAFLRRNWPGTGQRPLWRICAAGVAGARAASAFPALSRKSARGSAASEESPPRG